MSDVRRWIEPLTDAHVATHGILEELFQERLRQTALFGPQSLPDGNDLGGDYSAMLRAQEKVEAAKRDGTLTWRLLLAEETAEIKAARTPKELRAELVQAGALIVAQIEDIDRRRPR